MKKMLTLLCVLGLVALPAQAGLFKIDFGGGEDTAGWDRPALGADTAYSLTDQSGSGDDDVTLTRLDIPGGGWGSSATGPPTSDGFFDGITVPVNNVYKDYGYSVPQPISYAYFKFENLDPSPYNVTVFSGRITNNNGQYGKLWIGLQSDEPAGDENTGNYANGGDTGGPGGVTHQFTIAAGDTFWFRHQDDGQGGTSGMIVRLVPEPATMALLGFGGIGVLLRRRRK